MTANEGAADKPPARPVRVVYCAKFKRNLPGLDEPPWPGELGQRIYENVSEDAWKLWERQMTMILNEYRLLPFQKEAQELMARYMEEFFFGETAAMPPGYVPEPGSGEGEPGPR
jgi:Fe-S cluster biosynthesis and repair protein YggX